MNSPNNDNPIARLVGLILIVIGVIWLVTTGLCSAVFAVDLLASVDTPGTEVALAVLLTISVLSAFIGAIFYAIGRWFRPRQT